MAIEFFVSPAGNDAWSGRLPEPAGSDGPFRTVARAQEAVCAMKSDGQLSEEARVVLRGGTYFLDSPLRFTPEDSGTPSRTVANKTLPAAPITYTAFADETPVLSGGRRITGWRQEQVNSKTAWVTTIPEVQRGEWYFRQLFVNGERRMRPRLPKKGFYRIAELVDAHFEGSWGETTAHGSDQFYYAEGDIQAWKNLQDVEIGVVALWVSMHARIKEINEAERLVTLDRNSGYRMTDDQTRNGARYYVDNVFEALGEPGEWYLDRPTGNLYYLPMPGETPETAEVIAPCLSELLRIEGEPEGAKVEKLHFEGLTFAHCEWWVSEERGVLRQSATEVPGAVALANAQHVDFTHCSFAHMATIGVEMIAGCRDVQVRGCDFRDLGAGAVRIWHGCNWNTVTDCEIGPGGLLFHSAAGVVIGKASGNKIVHNHIHDFTYSGISVGWTWGYAENDAYGNIIEYNHIHNLGKGLLSDMGGVYTLGVSPGTRIRYNVIHDIRKYCYGGWAIYTDEGSADILIENNLCFRTHSSSFHQHYGKDNVVRNNIFAFGEEHQIERSRTEPHCSFIIERNIIYYREGELLGEGYAGGNWSPENATFRENLYFDASGRPVTFAGKTLEEWQALGMDQGSVIADPRFVDVTVGDFRLRNDSPAFALGFTEFDLSTVGPRPEYRRKC